MPASTALFLRVLWKYNRWSGKVRQRPHNTETNEWEIEWSNLESERERGSWRRMVVPILKATHTQIAAHSNLCHYINLYSAIIFKHTNTHGEYRETRIHMHEKSEKRCEMLHACPTVLAEIWKRPRDIQFKLSMYSVLCSCTRIHTHVYTVHTHKST